MRYRFLKNKFFGFSHVSRWRYAVHERLWVGKISVYNSNVLSQGSGVKEKHYGIIYQKPVLEQLRRPKTAPPMDENSQNVVYMTWEVVRGWPWSLTKFEERLDFLPKNSAPSGEISQKLGNMSEAQWVICVWSMSSFEQSEDLLWIFKHVKFCIENWLTYNFWTVYPTWNVFSNFCQPCL